MRFVDYSLEDIEKDIVRGARIVFFGAGRALTTFCRRSRYMNWSEAASYVADNNENIWGMEKVFDTVKLKIDSIEKILLKEKGSVIVVLVTQYATSEIYWQLSQLNVPERIVGVYFGFAMEKSLENGIYSGKFAYSLPKENVEIPKVIHYCWFGKNSIPDYCREWMKSWRKYCPDYEIVEWNEDNYDVRKCEYMCEAYDAKQWSYVSDYARLDIIYNYGGIYLDTDVELLRNLDPFRFQEAFAFFQDVLVVSTGLGFGAVPNNPIIKEMRDYYDKFHYNEYDRGSCIRYQMPILEKYGLIANGTFQQIPHINIFPANLAINKYAYRGEMLSDYKGYTIHHGTAFYENDSGRHKLNLISEIYKDIIRRSDDHV